MIWKFFRKGMQNLLWDSVRSPSQGLNLFWLMFGLFVARWRRWWYKLQVRFCDDGDMRMLGVIRALLEGGADSSELPQDWVAALLVHMHGVLGRDSLSGDSRRPCLK